MLFISIEEKSCRAVVSFALIDIVLAIKLKSRWLKLLAWTVSMTSTPNVWKGSQWRGGHHDPEVLQVIGSPEQPPQDPWQEQRPEPRPRSGQELATWETVWFTLSSKCNKMNFFYFMKRKLMKTYRIHKSHYFLGLQHISMKVSIHLAKARVIFLI